MASFGVIFSYYLLLTGIIACRLDPYLLNIGAVGCKSARHQNDRFNLNYVITWLLTAAPLQAVALGLGSLVYALVLGKD